MNSIILHTATRILVSLILLFSLYILFRGHNEPGGGFIGGLIAASAIILYAVSFGSSAARDVMRAPSLAVAGLGLFFAVVAGLLPAIAGAPFLTGLWWEPGVLKELHFPLSTPLLFDIGVYLVVIGAVATIALELEEARD